MPRDSFSVQTPETLRAMAVELERLAAQYRAAAESWVETKIDELPVKGESERKRALTGASAFAQNALNAMWGELDRRAKFGDPISRKEAQEWLKAGKGSTEEASK